MLFNNSESLRTRLPIEIIQDIAALNEYKDFYGVNKYFYYKRQGILESEASSNDLSSIKDKNNVKRIELIGKDELTISSLEIKLLLPELKLFTKCSTLVVYESRSLFKDKAAIYSDLFDAMPKINILKCYGQFTEPLIDSIGTITDLLLTEIPLNIHKLNTSYVTTLRLDLSECKIISRMPVFTSIQIVHFDTLLEDDLKYLHLCFSNAKEWHFSLYGTNKISFLESVDLPNLKVIVNYYTMSYKEDHLKLISFPNNVKSMLIRFMEDVDILQLSSAVTLVKNSRLTYTIYLNVENVFKLCKYSNTVDIKTNATNLNQSTLKKLFIPIFGITIALRICK